MLNFKIAGESYEYDDSAMTIAEAREIKKYAGLGLVSWARGLADGDPDALVALVYLAKKRAGEAIRWQDLDSLNIADLELGDQGDVTPPVRTPSTRSRSGRTPKV